MGGDDLKFVAFLLLGALVVLGSIAALMTWRYRHAARILRELAESRGWCFVKTQGIVPDPLYAVEAENARPRLSIGWWPPRYRTPGVTRTVAHLGTCPYFRSVRQGRAGRLFARGNVRLDDPAYHRRFSVEATDSTWPRRILSPEIRAQHLEYPVNLVVAEGDLVAVRVGLPRDGQELAGIVDLVLRLGQRIEQCATAEPGEGA